MHDSHDEAPSFPQRLAHRLREQVPPSLALLAAAAVLLGITRTGIVATSDHVLPTQVTVAIVVLSLPGPFLRCWDLLGQILLWNALGWCLALVALGLTSVGATTLVPLVLLLFGLSLWPRPEDGPSLWLPGTIALAGGAIACVILWESGGVALPGLR